VRPSAQGSGIGAVVLAQVFEAADAVALPITVGALKESASNRFTPAMASCSKAVNSTIIMTVSTLRHAVHLASQVK